MEKPSLLKLAQSRLREDLSALPIWPTLVIWLNLLILTPIAQWIWAQAGFVVLTNLGVLANLTASLAILSSTWTRRRLAIRVALILPVAWLVEFVGHSTGFPFGAYQYTPLLQPQLGGVPLLIPLAWLMMLPPAWGVAARLVSPHRRLAHAALSGLAFTAWDLYLDPQMVINQLWSWREPGAYFGIPISNFIGWWICATLISLLARPDNLPERPLGLVYSLVWVFEAIGLGLFWGQPGPALTGFLAMGLFVLVFWRRETWL